MSVKNPSVKVFLQKNLPKSLCGYKFYDRYIQRLTDVSPHKAWTVFHQVFVDELFNKGSSRKWTGVPYLTPVDCPCSPGSVILVREKSLRSYIKGLPHQAFIAGLVTDFFPPDLNYNPALVPVQEKSEIDSGSNHQYRKVYQAKNSEIAVVITINGVNISSVEKQLKAETTFLDLDNFDSTGFKSTSCYVITRVLSVDMLKIEVTLNGDVFYEHTFSAGVPVCFHASKVHVLEDGRGLLKDMTPIKKKLPINILKRRAVQHFLNSFLPNQNRLGNAVGDAPAVLNWQEPPSLRSYRPNFLPRPERAHQTDLIYYYKTDQELVDIIYGNRTHTSAEIALAERHRRNRLHGRRPEVRVTERGVNTEAYDEAHAVPSEDESTVTSGFTTDGTETSDESFDDTSEDDEDMISSENPSDDEDTISSEDTSDGSGDDSTDDDQVVDSK